MFLRPHSALLRVALAIAIAACVGGCATQTPNAGNIASAHEAQAAVTPGKSTKADVEATLGKAIAVQFDSGYEIWVYREQSAAAGWYARPSRQRAELVLLFEPSGVLKKSRIRDAS
jgi:outer membrane lipoprotein SlyB